MTTRRSFLKGFVLASGGLLVAPRWSPLDECFGQANADAWAQMPAILRRIKPPVFPKRDFVITRFGAVGDGRTDCTEAFRKAIARCASARGGRVVVPAGTFLTGPIHLKSNVNLHVSEDATIKFSQDPKKYLPVVFSRWEGVEVMNYSPFICALDQMNIAITGTGALDGQAGSGLPDEGWARRDHNWQ